MKIKLFFEVIVIMVLTMMMSIQSFAYDNSLSVSKEDISNQLKYLNDISNMDVSYSIKSTELLYGADDTIKYALYELNPFGYAIINLNTGVFEEINWCATQTPYHNILNCEKSFYFGPNNFYAIVEGKYVNVQNGLVLSNDQLQKFTTMEHDKEHRDMNISSSIEMLNSCRLKNNIEKYNANGTTNYIPNSFYFTSLLGDDYALNEQGTCTIVAVQILLGYYDVYVNDGFVSDNFRSGFGTTDYFHSYLRFFLNPTGWSTGIVDASNGLQKYFENQNIYAFPQYVIGNHNYVLYLVADNISRGLPVIASIFNSYNADAPFDHTVVVYGYSSMTDIYGNVIGINYHCHNGWKGAGNANYSTYNHTWFADALAISY